MDKLKSYVELKKRAEQAQQEADKAEGALEQIMKQLKEKFSCTTLEAAERKLKLLEKQEQKAKTEFEDAVEKFEEKWNDESEGE